jgi:carboxypeptidase C (cathepsin A)
VDVYDALKVFFQGFSEFANNEFYITGESCM